MKLSYFLMLVPLLLATSCEKEDPEIDNAEEVITTLTVELQPQDGSAPVIFSFQDLDGDGGNDPTIQSAPLSENTSYAVSIKMLNEQADPTEDITEEVEEEADEHQLFFATNLEGLTFEYDDMDSNGNPLGLQTTWMTGSAGSGTVTIVLRHEPNKTLPSVIQGDISEAGGETDIEITFDVTVQ